MSGPGIIWTTEFLRCKSVLNGYLNTSLSDCTDLLSDNTPAVPVKLSISRNKDLQRGVSPARVCDCTKYECVHTSNTGQTRGARSDASRHVSKNQEPNLNHNHWHNEVASGLLNGRKVRSPRRAGGFFKKRTNKPADLDVLVGFQKPSRKS